MADEMLGYDGLKSKYVLYIICAITAALVILVVIAGMEPITFTVYDPAKTDHYLTNLDEAKSDYNARAADLPSLFLIVFGDERINATLIRLNSERVNIAVETDNGRIVDMKKGEMQEPSMQLEVMESTIKRITESDNAVDEVEQALNNEEIKYKAETAKTTFKMAVLEATIEVWSWFT